MKKAFYIVAFVFLGFLLQLLLHGIIEQIYIKLLISDFIKFGFGLNWGNWYLIHRVFTVVLLVGGLAFGYCQGKYWWPRLYAPDGKRKIWR